MSDLEYMFTDGDGKPKTAEYSLVIPVFNEEESIKELFAEILQAMTPLNQPYEVIFVNDCSHDSSLAIMQEFRRQLPEIVKIIDLKERSGQTLALKKGLREAKGRVIFSLDADLQNDPADIIRLLEKMGEGGYHCVCGWRKNRNDTYLKAVLSKLGNVLQRTFTGMKIHDVSCTLRSYKRECVGQIALNWEGQHRFIPLSLSLQGFKVGEIMTNHRTRKFGRSKYSHRRIFRVVGDFFKVLKSKGRA